MKKRIAPIVFLKYPILVLFACAWLAACRSAKNFKVGDDVNKGTYERLLKEFIKDTGNKELGVKIQYAYGQLEAEKLTAIEKYKANPTPNILDRRLDALTGLQQFYDGAAAHPALAALVSPGNVNLQIADARLDATEAWYVYANDLLAQRYWQAARQAQDALIKVNRLTNNYKDTRQLTVLAAELAIIDVTIAPVRSENYTYNTGYSFSNRDFSRQLVANLGGKNTGNGKLRVWNEEGDGRINIPVTDLLVEPVWIKWKMEPESQRSFDRTITKEIEAGQDSLKRPVYKTITATLHITEFTIVANGEFQVRISDVVKQSELNKKIWKETLMLKTGTAATLSGDANALNQEDYALLGNNQVKLKPEQEEVKGKILQKIYPDLLQYLRAQLK